MITLYFDTEDCRVELRKMAVEAFLDEDQETLARIMDAYSEIGDPLDIAEAIHTAIGRPLEAWADMAYAGQAAVAAPAPCAVPDGSTATDREIVAWIGGA